MRSVQILENTSARFVAVQAPQSWGPVPAILSLATAAFLVRFLSTRQWRLAVLPGVFLLVFLLLWLVPANPTFTLTLDVAARSILSEGTKSGKIVSQFQVPAADISSAEMQFNRGARTIVMIRNDGSLLYPLGKENPINMLF